MENTKKIALVTGASQGIGAAIAKRLAQDKMFVLVNYCGSKEAAEETVDQINAAGGSATAVRFDVSDEASCKAAVDTLLKTYGPIEVLVNNAGITRDGLLMAMSEQDFQDVIATNLTGAFHMMKMLTRNFLKLKRGRIINITSVSGVAGNAGQANYCAAKAGMIGLTKSAAKELAAKNITVNAIAPGLIKTRMVEQMPEEAKAKLAGQIPMKRMGNPEEIAALVSFLASDDAAYITGQVLHVDGGMCM